MWFNHKTVIFGGAHASRKAKTDQRTKVTRNLGHDQLADIGIESNVSDKRLATITSLMVHESRFTGYRGDMIV